MEMVCTPEVEEYAMNFSKKKSWTTDEKRIVTLLLEGDSEFLHCLRRQLTPPFFLWVERRSPSTKPQVYKTPPNEYVIDIVFDGSLEDDFSAGSDLSLDIDDLTILETRLKQDLRRLGIMRLDMKDGYAILTFSGKEKISPGKIVDLIGKDTRRYRFSPDGRLHARVGSIDHIKKILQELI